MIDPKHSTEAHRQEVRDALLEAVEHGDLDRADGGASPQLIADYCDYAPSTISKHLNRLCEEGEAVRVHGLGPNGPRASWLPADHPDADQSIEAIIDD